MVDAPDPYTERDARTFIAVADRGWDEHTRKVFAIVEAGDGTPLGVVDLHRGQHGDRGLASAGYWLLPAARGRGVATQSLRLVAEWAFAELGVQRLFLHCPGQRRFPTGSRASRLHPGGSAARVPRDAARAP